MLNKWLAYFVWNKWEIVTIIVSLKVLCWYKLNWIEQKHVLNNTNNFNVRKKSFGNLLTNYTKRCPKTTNGNHAAGSGENQNARRITGLRTKHPPNSGWWIKFNKSAFHVLRGLYESVSRYYRSVHWECGRGSFPRPRKGVLIILYLYCDCAIDVNSEDQEARPEIIITRPKMD